jgi:hypothetical protein
MARLEDNQKPKEEALRYIRQALSRFKEIRVVPQGEAAQTEFACTISNLPDYYIVGYVVLMHADPLLLGLAANSLQVENKGAFYSELGTYTELCSFTVSEATKRTPGGAFRPLALKELCESISQAAARSAITHFQTRSERAGSYSTRNNWAKEVDRSISELKKLGVILPGNDIAASEAGPPFVFEPVVPITELRRRTYASLPKGGPTIPTAMVEQAVRAKASQQLPSLMKNLRGYLSSTPQIETYDEPMANREFAENFIIFQQYEYEGFLPPGSVKEFVELNFRKSALAR